MGHSHFHRKQKAEIDENRFESTCVDVKNHSKMRSKFSSPPFFLVSFLQFQAWKVLNRKKTNLKTASTMVAWIFPRYFWQVLSRIRKALYHKVQSFEDFYAWKKFRVFRYLQPQLELLSLFSAKLLEALKSSYQILSWNFL